MSCNEGYGIVAARTNGKGAQARKIITPMKRAFMRSILRSFVRSLPPSSFKLEDLPFPFFKLLTMLQL
ncbi:hypothetical protein GYMLUDRAFT_437491 [Collybiopsis luxurians FD-317 M1]|uniref:Uncharacterized protein n=1 Tax=Collybiopsis luxurians FD-317 M1 TaxID=944289 RepID=A0A0D0CMC5_9AGAR|nr:hypothetical protein GYMLUDRAFT_437491 [Collybiopsis luxurians FD-317 M1]